MPDFPSVFAFSPATWNVVGTNSPRQFWIAAGMTLAFTLVARLVKGVSDGGAVAGAIICFSIYWGTGAAGFLILISVFVLTWFTTRWGYQKKQRLGVAEKRDGRRAPQVLANLGIAALCSLLHALNPTRTIYLLALAAALSEAAADTVSSEMGQASSEQARLITSWERVPAGSNGGMTLIGTLAGIIAAALVSLVCVTTGLIPRKWFGISLAAAVAGVIADSYLGATLERRRILTNDSVNFLGTCVAAALALWIA
jgi:uncharacterized protein (TIGR00297 family)